MAFYQCSVHMQSVFTDYIMSLCSVNKILLKDILYPQNYPYLSQNLSTFFITPTDLIFCIVDDI